MKQVLSIEQMQHLQELGLELKETLLLWCVRDSTITDLFPTWMVRESGWDYTIPAYTLQDVLESLPVKLGVNGKVHITRDFLTSAWTVEYFEGATLGRVSFDNEELIDAAYDMLCLLVEKGYVTNKA